MQKMKIEEVQKNLSKLVEKIDNNGERVIIQRNGRNCAAIISFADYEALERIENIIDLQEADSALLEAEREGIIDFNDYPGDSDVDDENFDNDYDDDYSDDVYHDGV